jgi:hypothetical protein
MRWYLNQAVSLYEFGSVERLLSPACQTNCFQGEASAAYDPCGNMISLVAQSTINPSYDQPINGPIEFHIPEQGQWELKEQLANLTKVNITLGEMGVSAASSADDDCGESICGGSSSNCNPKTRTPINDQDTEWFRSVTSWYEKMKNMSCEELKKEKDYWMGFWEHHQKNWGWSNTYNHYNPWNQKEWELSVMKNLQTIYEWVARYDPDLHIWVPVIKYGFDQAIQCNTVRVEVALLQTIDCLLRFCKNETDSE